MSHPHASMGFCENVCRFYKPFTYWARVKREDPTGEAIETYVMEQPPQDLGEGETLVLREHKGCIARWRG